MNVNQPVYVNHCVCQDSTFQSMFFPIESRASLPSHQSSCQIKIFIATFRYKYYCYLFEFLGKQPDDQRGLLRVSELVRADLGPSQQISLIRNPETAPVVWLQKDLHTPSPSQQPAKVKCSCVLWSSPPSMHQGYWNLNHVGRGLVLFK